MGDVFMAAAGASPIADAAAWSKVGQTVGDLRFEDNTRQDAFDVREALCALSGLSFSAEVELAPGARHSMFGPPDGIQLFTSEVIPPGQAWVMSGKAAGGSPAVVAHRADYREFTEAEYAGIVARRIVRHGMADVLKWLGEPLGPAPDAPLPKAFHLLSQVMVREDWLFGSTARIVNLDQEQL
jgi:hypothetical protein